MFMKSFLTIFVAVLVTSIWGGVFTVPPSEFADTESIAGATLRATAPRTLSCFTLDASCRNLSTNAFELRFATAPGVDGGTVRFVLGFDNGAWYTAGNDPASFVPTTNAAPPGAFALTIAVTFNNNDAPAVVSVLAGGSRVPCLESAVAAAEPKSWRGVTALSRRTDAPQPSATATSDNFGLKVIIR